MTGEYAWVRSLWAGNEALPDVGTEGGDQTQSSVGTRPAGRPRAREFVTVQLVTSRYSSQDRDQVYVELQLKIPLQTARHLHLPGDLVGMRLTLAMLTCSQHSSQELTRMNHFPSPPRPTSACLFTQSL